MAEKLGSLMVEVGANVARLQRDMGKMRQEVNSSFQQMQRSAGHLKTAFASTFAVLGVGAVAREALRQFSDFDKGLIGVAKTTGLAGTELAAFGRQIQDMTLVLATSDEELLGIAQAAGQLGVTGTQNLLAFSKTVAQLGMSSDLAGEEAATALARMMNVAGESADNVATLGSVIVALGNQMAATESEIARMGTEIGQATAQFGTSSAESAALGAALRSVGVRAELGGSAVGRAFRAIDSSIREGGDSMRELESLTGRTADQLRQQFGNDAVGVFQLFVEGLGRVVAQGGSATATLEGFGLKGEEIQKVLPVIALRSELLGQALGIAAGEVEHATALTTEAIAAQRSFSAQMKLTGNAIDLIASDIGAQLAPVLVDLAQDFRSWVSENRDLIADLGEGAGEAAVAVGKIAATAGKLLSGVADGWNSLPSIVQDIGLIGAVVGGTAARAAILLLVTAIGKAKEFNEIAAGVSDISITDAKINQELQLLASLQDRRANLSPGSGSDSAMIPVLDDQIAAVEARIATLRERYDAADRMALVGTNEWSGGASSSGGGGSGGSSGGTSSSFGGPSADEAKKIANDMARVQEWLSSQRIAMISDEYDRRIALIHAEADEQEAAAHGNVGLLAQIAETEAAQVAAVEAERAKQQEQNRQTYMRALMTDQEREIAATREKYDKLLTLASENFMAMVELARQREEEIAAINEEYADKALRESKDAYDGMVVAAADWADSATNAALQWGSALTNTIQSAEDVWVKFCQTGELSFSDLVDSVVADLARISFRSTVGSAIESILGDSFSGLFNAHGNVFGPSGLVPFAHGGVVTAPTIFPFASGVGLMGEAGPEAIMPLTRTAGGDLGVRMEGGSSGAQIELRVTVVNEDGGQTRMEQTGQDVYFDGEKWVAETFMRAYRGDVSGLRTGLQRGL